MCEKCNQRFDVIINGVKEIIIESYVTAFKIKDELKPGDYDIMSAFAIAMAGDFAAMANPEDKDPLMRVMEMLGKSQGADGVMFIGGTYPTPEQLGVKDRLQVGKEGTRNVDIGRLELPKKDKLS